jgi:hypothetical protein
MTFKDGIKDKSIWRLGFFSSIAMQHKKETKNPKLAIYAFPKPRQNAGASNRRASSLFRQSRYAQTNNPQVQLYSFFLRKAFKDARA